jgi:hypothetical protein
MSSRFLRLEVKYKYVVSKIKKKESMERNQICGLRYELSGIKI